MCRKHQQLQPLPVSLQQKSQCYLEALLQTDRTKWDKLDQQSKNRLESILGLSDFVAEHLCRHPEWIADVLADPAKKPTPYLSELVALLEKITDEDEAKKTLRHYRHRQMVMLACQDFLSLSPLNHLLIQISALAEALIIAARDWLYLQLCNQYGTPCDKQGNSQPLLILGMGKLGGKELNFSSDIDLIFVFPEHGETCGGRRQLDNQQFFTRMGQKLVKLLDQVTCDGFVFRVDMRLRPYGDSGPLVVSSSGFEDYYQEQGRDWERYAMVKARVLGPKTVYGEALQQLLRPFVYRRYIDFSAIEALRKMKILITREVLRRKLTDNIKLGAGGIREVEFVVQSFQLIRGGREQRLRCQSLYQALQILGALKLLTSKLINELEHDYSFLRRIENLLQAMADKQTQTLPDNALGWQRLCWTLNKTETQLRAEISQAMAQIHRHFLETIGGEDEQDVQEHWTMSLWYDDQEEDAKALLDKHGIDGDKLWPALHQWREHTLRRAIGPRGRDTLDRLMPKLLADLFGHQQPCDAFMPVSKVLDQILTRTTYLELLCENPGARQQLVTLCCASPWIAEQLARYPMLLDELIDPVQLYATTKLDDYSADLRQYLLRIPEDDMEQQMEALRQFKLSRQLKIAAADITGILPVMQVSDHLTHLAQAIIEQVVHYAWQQIASRHGIPTHLQANERGFAVIGYGKLGGMELGYGSDLDLVFLHNAAQGIQTDGERPIDASHFYLKLAQRILHLFSTRTVSGALYEVDMRLRPSGSSGLLVSEIENFSQYQINEAWTWEHQALVRARFIYGDKHLAQRFNAIRTQVLSAQRDKEQLKNEVQQMRLKMREHLLKVPDGQFDLKQSTGGIADIEFIAQYLVLTYSHDYPELTLWSDNVRIFNQLCKLAILSTLDTELLISVYCLLRDESHHLVLQGISTQLPTTQINAQISGVERVYQRLLG